MDSINRTESVFTDKTNTITKNGVTKNVFSKGYYPVDNYAMGQENQPEIHSDGKCSSLFGYCGERADNFTSDGTRGEFQTKEDAIMQQKSALSNQHPKSIHSDYSNHPDRAIESFLIRGETSQKKDPGEFSQFHLITPVRTGQAKEFIRISDGLEPESKMQEELFAKNTPVGEINTKENDLQVQIISLETTPRCNSQNVRNTILLAENQQKRHLQINKHQDGKQSVGIKSSLLKKRINQKAISAKTSVSKYAPAKPHLLGKMSVNSNMVKQQHLKTLEFNLKGKTTQVQAAPKIKKDTGFITPCKPSLKNIVLVDAEVEDMTDNKSYLSHTAQSINRAISRFNKDATEAVKEPERAPDGKVKLVEPKEFTLRSDARCEERKRIRDQREKSRREKELLETYVLNNIESDALGRN